MASRLIQSKNQCPSITLRSYSSPPLMHLPHFLLLFHVLFTSTTLTSLLFFEYIRRTCISGPLHLLFCLDVFSQYSLASSFTSFRSLFKFTSGELFLGYPIYKSKLPSKLILRILSTFLLQHI